VVDAAELARALDRRSCATARRADGAPGAAEYASVPCKPGFRRRSNVALLSRGHSMSLALALAAALALQPAVVEQPRSFGYVIGDIATQRVLLEAQGRTFTPDRLPGAGPLGNWVERRATRIERDARGRPWLAVDYQIMNAPQTIMLVTLPAWKLADLAVPEWQISVAPLTLEQPFARGGLGSLRPDRATPTIDLAPMRRWMTIWTGCALALILWWAGWWG